MMKKIYMIGNTHFDPVWLWKWDEAMASIRATFRSALERMKEDENFIYSFATPPVFEYIKEVDPDMFEEIKQRVKEGRWDIPEAWWVQPDCYSAMGESYARHGLYGQKFLKENFGKISDTVFNVDSFGHSTMLPQILNKMGVDKYCFVRPEKHHVQLEQPLFKWTSPDGSSVSAYRCEDSFAYDTAERIDNDPDYGCNTMVLYGVTDHGGAPTKEAIAAVNANKHTKFSTVAGYFEENTPSFEYNNELVTGDFGPYSNGVEVKKLNRIAEYALLNAEKTSVFANKNQKAAIEKCWHDVMFNQFHDIQGACCIKDAAFDTVCMNGRAIADANYMMHTNMQYITKNINMPGSNDKNAWNVVIWNLNGSDFSGYIEAEAQWAHEFTWYDKGIELMDSDGNVYPCQIIREKSVIPRFRSRFLFKADIPAFGYRAFAVMQNNKEIEHPVCDDLYHISTDKLEINISKQNGYIESIKDKSGKVICGNTMRLVAQYDDGDTWCFNIEDYDSEYIDFEFVGMTLIEKGEFRTVVKADYKFKNSLASVYYTAFKDTDYVDVRYKVNWNEKHYVVKLINKAESKHLCTVPYGATERGEFKGDYPMGEWIKTSNATYICDSIFAYGMKDGNLGLTVLRSPIYGDYRFGEIDYDVDYDIMEQGITEGNIRILLNDDIQSESVAFNNPPVVILEANHEGTMPSQYSYIDFNAEHTYITTVKNCEHDNSVIIRMYEHDGKAETATLKFGDVDCIVNIKPYEIKTLKIEHNSVKEVNILEEEV